jgi:hypothetical protein
MTLEIIHSGGSATAPPTLTGRMDNRAYAAAGAGGALTLNASGIFESYTIPAGKNAVSTGPLTIADGVTVTVSSGSRWVIV